MRPAWSSFLALAAAAAAFDAHVAAAGTTESPARAAVFSAQDFLPRSAVLEEIANSSAKTTLVKMLREPGTREYVVIDWDRALNGSAQGCLFSP